MGRREMNLNKQDHRSLVRWATDCAEHVLLYFEEEYPEDYPPQEAIEAGRAWARDEITVGDARTAAFEAHAVARDADYTVAVAAARATGHAAATAHVASHAPHAADYAVKAAEAVDAMGEREWQHQCLPEHLHPVLADYKK